MVAACPPPCLHCERNPSSTDLGLCAACFAVKGLRKIYKHRRGWSPAWEAHLRRLAERARLRLPLFDDEPTDQHPSRD